MELHGGRQCGRIRFRAEGPAELSSACYCRMCQRTSGGPFMVFVRFPARKVAWSRHPEVFASFDAVERGFCRECGTPLTYRRIDTPNISVTLNSLDDPDQAPPPSVGLAAERRAGWLDGLGDLPLGQV